MHKTETPLDYALTYAIRHLGYDCVVGVVKDVDFMTTLHWFGGISISTSEHGLIPTLVGYRSSLLCPSEAKDDVNELRTDEMYLKIQNVMLVRRVSTCRNIKGGKVLTGEAARELVFPDIRKIQLELTKWTEREKEKTYK